MGNNDEYLNLLLGCLRGPPCKVLVNKIAFPTLVIYLLLVIVIVIHRMRDVSSVNRIGDGANTGRGCAGVRIAA